MEKKLNELLGNFFGEQAVAKIEEKKKSSTGNIQGITEDEIQNFREAQGITYFLQAPALFQSRICKHCDAPYLVSRMYVAYCSWTCIDKSMQEAYGVKYRRLNGDIEDLVREVYDGNEPLWIRNLEGLKLALTKVISTLEPTVGDTTVSDQTPPDSTPSQLVRL